MTPPIQRLVVACSELQFVGKRRGSFLTSFLLAGYIFPVQNMPLPLRFLSYFVPMRYYLEVIRDAFLRGGGWSGLWTAPLALALLGLFFFWRAWSVMKDMQVKA